MTTCPAEGCGELVEPAMIACHRHYHNLPAKLRRSLNNTWRTGVDTPGHATALEACRRHWNGS